MNPFIYESFKSDMTQASDHFIRNSSYKIKDLDSSSLILSDGINNLNFYLDGASLVATFNRVGKNEKSIYELFVENNIEEKYPFDKLGDYSYEEWNKYKVKRILEILNQDLKACL